MDFSGDLAEQTRIIVFMEDCSASYHHKQIRVQTGTAHPAMIRLSEENYGHYGHMGKTPVYLKALSYYQWILWIDLNVSFKFLVEYKKNRMRFLRKISESGYEYVGIASLTDTEGSVFIDANGGYPRAVLSIANNDKQILEWSQAKIGGGISRYQEGYKLRLYRKEAVEALRRLPLMHEEKTAAKELILRHFAKEGIGWDALEEYQELRRRVNEEVQLCRTQARLEYIRRHRRTHPYDPNQTTPKNLALSLPLFLVLSALLSFYSSQSRINHRLHA